ncbi:GNAT family N-acetyltransferase [Micromonospora sp. NPDC005174]|uniref:GNAT family N-acetyltransferase n=1 Tax=Micromonospora sp. NPDC005174 TaxID=3157018 RepID=UPI0033B60855
MDDDNIRAYVALANERAIGYLAVSDTRHHGWLEWDTTDRVNLTDDTLRARVNIIHVAKMLRGQGVGRRLVEAMAFDTDVAVEDISWSMPFSSAGRSLAQSMSPDGVWVS